MHARQKRRIKNGQHVLLMPRPYIKYDGELFANPVGKIRPQEDGTSALHLPGPPPDIQYDGQLVPSGTSYAESRREVFVQTHPERIPTATTAPPAIARFTRPQAGGGSISTGGRLPVTNPENDASFLRDVNDISEDGALDEINVNKPGSDIPSALQLVPASTTTD